MAFVDFQILALAFTEKLLSQPLSRLDSALSQFQEGRRVCVNILSP